MTMTSDDAEDANVEDANDEDAYDEDDDDEVEMGCCWLRDLSLRNCLHADNNQDDNN